MVLPINGYLAEYPSNVYVAVGYPTGIVKVGMSMSPEERCVSLHGDYNLLLKGAGKPCVSFSLVHVEPIETCKAAYVVETAAHDLLHRYRSGIGAEWFKVDPGIATDAVIKACKITNYGKDPYKKRFPRPSRQPPRKPFHKDPVTVSFLTERDIMETIEKLAREDGRTVKNWIEKNLIDHMKENGWLNPTS